MWEALEGLAQADLAAHDDVGIWWLIQWRMKRRSTGGAGHAVDEREHVMEKFSCRLVRL